jgi:hypothetical protein
MCDDVPTSDGAVGKAGIRPKKRQREQTDCAQTDHAELSALAQLLGDASTDFFARKWEQSPLHVHGAHARLPHWPELPSWATLLGVLDDASRGSESSVIMLKDQHPTAEYTSPAAAYLDGCSLIVNHAEAASPGVAQLCASLRSDVPHVFGNLYVTPPAGRAVDAHADDRDVLVVQLGGRKEWRVYSSPPVAFPSAHEQVGKSGVPFITRASSQLLAALIPSHLFRHRWARVVCLYRVRRSPPRTSRCMPISNMEMCSTSHVRARCPNARPNATCRACHTFGRPHDHVHVLVRMAP